MRRRWGRIALVAQLTMVMLVGPLSSPAVADVCTTSSPAGGAYSVQVCFTSPASGSIANGDLAVAVDVTVTGSNPGVAKLEFSLGNEYLLTDYEAPFSFDIPTQTFVDGTTSLGASAVMRDGYVTPQTSLPITLSNGVSTPPSPPTNFTPAAGTSPAPGQPFVLAATGDGAAGRTQGDAVLQTISQIDPNMLMYLGDVYDDGTYTEFYNWYGVDDLWGRYRSITNPVLGNHEQNNGQWQGYDYYWGTPSPWYSYDAAGWHFIVLEFKDGPSQQELTWLANDLATSTAACTIAAFHHPVLSVGPQGNNPDLNGVWQMLVDAGVDIVLTGHDHSYQRWTPLDRNLQPSANGVTQFVIGAGGHGVQEFVRNDSRLAAGADTVPDALGALRLELNANGAAFGYHNVNGVVLDSGTVQCSGAQADTVPPSTPTGLTAQAPNGIQVDLTWSPSTDNVGVTEYRIYRGGALAATVSGSVTSWSDTTVIPDTTYSYTVEARDAAGNVSARSLPAVVTTPGAPAAITLNPVADAYVDGGTAGTNFGSSTSLLLDTSPTRRSYVRFDVAGVSGVVTSAVLRVFAGSSLSAGFDVQGVASNGWVESSVTYANAPAFGPWLAWSGPVSAGGYVEVDVTGYVTDNGLVSFALTPLSSTNLRLTSRETATPPELVLVQDTSGNAAPVAGDVALSAGEDAVGVSWSPVVSDPDGDGLTCSIVSQPGFGSASVASDCSSGSYTPDPDYNGSDSLVYEVSDGSLTDTGVVSVTVAAVNDAPVADPQSVSTVSGVPVTVGLSGSDVDGDCPLSFVVSSPPAHGSLGSISGVQCDAGVVSAEVVYTPDAGFGGSDDFEVTLSDPSAAVSVPAVVSVAVTAPATDLTLVPVADAYVSGSAVNNNFGSSDQLRMDSSPDLRSYVRFDVAGVSGVVTSAVLRVFAGSSLSAGFDVQGVASNGWVESSVTYANAPAFGPWLAWSGPVSAGGYVEVDVTGYVTDNGLVSFALTPLSSTNLRLTSRETATPPQLVLQIEP